MKYLSGEQAEILQQLTHLRPPPGMHLVLLIAEGEQLDLPSLVHSLRSQNIPFIGGMFPRLILEEEVLDRGVITFPMQFQSPPQILDLSQLEKSLEGLTPPPDPGNGTALILVDGLSARIGRFLRALHNYLGHSVNYFGGGAGSLTLQQQACLISSEGVFEEAAIIAYTQNRMSLGVRHGWQVIHGPLVATQTEGNRIQELNWQNAFEVYRSVVESDSGQKIRQENFFELAKGYPFGISRSGAEDIVRDPISVTDSGELICVGEVPKNSVLHILRGEASSLIESAGRAAADSCSASPPGKHQAFIVDCISRVLFLEEEFTRELAEVKRALNHCELLPPPVGVLSLGEISSYSEGLLEFFNKTIVVGLHNPFHHA